MRKSLIALASLALGLLVLAAGPKPEAQAGGAVPLRIGMVQTFFHDVPTALVQLVTEPFSTIMRETTGLSGSLVAGGDAFAVARNLSEGKLQLAVFHGHEFAWIQKKHPELQPLMIAINSQRSVCAYVLVHKDSGAGSFADLKGMELAIPKRTREHCRVYVERNCQDDGSCGSREFFAHVVHPANVETALDALGQGKAQAVLVDSIGLEFYKDLKPAAFDRLKIVAQSQDFPPAVIAYRPGAVNEQAIAQVRDGLQSAHKTELGRDMMKMWKITSFDPVPESYARALSECLKAYPSPEAK